MTDFVGTTGPDTWFGSSGNDTAHGGGGNDHLYGNEGDDQLFGEDGDDYLVGGPGNDLVDGGEGNDTLVIADLGPSEISSGDRFVGGNGFDTFFIQGSSNFFFDVSGVTIDADIEAIATNHAIVTIGFARFSQFSQMSGDFRLVGSGTLDLTGGRLAPGGSLGLGSGDDIVSLAGNPGFPSFPGLSVSYHLMGNGGNDQLIGSESMDSLDGGDGDDRLEGRGGNDSLVDGAGNDILLGGDGNDTLYDGAGDDTLDGGAGDDEIRLDLSNGFSAADHVTGGAGVDTLRIATSYFATVDFATLQVADDFERLIAGFARIVATAERISHLQYFEAQGLKLTTAGAVVLSDSFKVHQIELSDLGNSVDLRGGGAPGGSTVFGGAGNDTIFGSDQRAVETLSGGGGNDVIHAGDGHDEISGGEGADLVDGGAGDDLITIAQGESVSAGDHFIGGAGTDTLFIAGPTYGNDVLITDLTVGTIDTDIERLDGNALVGVRITVERLSGFSFIHINQVHLTNGGNIDFTGKECSLPNLYLSDVDTTIRLPGHGISNMYGGAGNDTVYVGSIALLVRGGGGDDHLYGGPDSDALYGDAGNDVLAGAGGGPSATNNLIGGTGNDTYLVDYQDWIEEKPGEGFDTVYASLSYVLTAGAEVEILSVNDVAATAAINLTGNEFGQALIGNAGNNILDGAGGADAMTGNGGDDVYIVDSAGDTVVEQAGGGIDEIRTALATYSIAALANVENLTGTSSSAQTLTGNDGANVLRSGGQASMIGGGGNDIYYVAGANDTVTEAAGGGVDEIRTALATYSIAALANVENLTGTSDQGQTLTGNAGANVLRGGTGNDVFSGGGGDDSYYVRNAGDSVVEASGGGNDRVYASVDYTLAAGQSIETLSTDNDAGTQAIVLHGNELGNSLIGNAGANQLFGLAGNDRIDGGAGNDILTGGAGQDRLTGGSGADVFVYTNVTDSVVEAWRSDGAKFLPDAILDFQSGTDKIDLSAIDAIAGTPGNDAFTFIGSAAFGHHAGELRAEIHDGYARLFADVDGDGAADMQITVHTTSLQAADFVL